MSTHHHPHGPDPVGGALLHRRRLLRAGAVGVGAALLTACRTSPGSDSAVTSSVAGASGGTSATATTAAPAAEAATTSPGSTVVDSTVADLPETLAGFDAFADTVRAFADGDVWLVESNGLPTHPMMIGITSWQQQVPVGQDYTGTNAWQLPRTPELAATPVSARTGLFRGAIALAVNGVPIFNALNNRGDDAFLAGELDEFGGHCGRADDYHYHVAPLHLEDAVGVGRPIAYALDGFPIYGSTEADGGPVEPLDEYNGHIGPDGSYHYHGTTSYPYINGGLVGVATITDQVEPQPTTPAFRPAGEPLNGAVITGFDEIGTGTYRLEYTVGAQIGTTVYTVTDGSVSFEFTSPGGVVTTEVYQR